MAVVYILYSKKLGTYYKGSCNDFEARFKDHNHGRVKYTKPGIPWEKVLIIEKETVSEARILERKLKNITSRERLLQFIEKYK